MRKQALDQQDAEQLRHLGLTIRASRRGRLSLEELAARARISSGQLSQIENGSGNPTIEMLLRVCGALGLTITDLMDRPRASSTYVVRAAERREYPLPGMRLMTPGIRHQLSATHSVLAPGESHSTGYTEGFLLIYLLAGEIRFATDHTVHHLKGECSLAGSLPAVITAEGESPVEYFGFFRPEATR